MRASANAGHGDYTALTAVTRAAGTHAMSRFCSTRGDVPYGRARAATAAGTCLTCGPGTNPSLSSSRSMFSGPARAGPCRIDSHCGVSVWSDPCGCVRLLSKYWKRARAVKHGQAPILLSIPELVLPFLLG